MKKHLQNGWQCLKNGEFFDAHEHWEIPWKTMCGHERSFWQAMIQLSVGAHHFENGNLTGCRNLWGKALRHCNTIIAYRLAIDETAVLQLRDAICDFLKSVEKGENPLLQVREFANRTITEKWLAFR